MSQQALEGTQEWQGAETLRQYLTPIDDLKGRPDNARRGNVVMLKESLERFGQVRPVLVEPDGVSLIAGHHLTLAAKQLGWTHLAAISAQFLDDEEVKAYSLADNLTHTAGDYNQPSLFSLIENFDETSLRGVASLDQYETIRDAAEQTSIVGRMDEDGWSYSQSEEDLARRAADQAAAQSMREASLMLTHDEYNDLQLHVRILTKHYGGTTVTETILRAVAETAARYEAHGEAATPGVQASPEVAEEDRLEDAAAAVYDPEETNMLGDDDPTPPIFGGEHGAAT